MADDDNDLNWNTDDEIDNFQSSPPGTSVHPACADDDNDLNWNTDDEIDNFQSSPPGTSVHPACADDVNDLNWNTDDEIDNFQSSPPGTSVPPACTNLVRASDETVARFVDMGFPVDMIHRAVDETGGENMQLILETLFKYSDEPNSSNEDGRLQALIEMNYSREEASLALERCGEDASLAEVVDCIFAAQMAQQQDRFYASPDEEEPTRRRRPNISLATDNELIRVPNPMIGFGVPNQPGILMQRPVPLPHVALRRPYFYYENVAMAPKGVWSKISSHLYGIVPEFVDSIYFCAAARKRGYIHNLPIENRFQLLPPPHQTIQEAFPSTKRWWPTWDKRTKLNCLLTCLGSAQLTDRIRKALEKHGGDPNVQKAVLEQCRKWNLLWVGKNKVAPLEPHEMEKLLGFPVDHTRGISRTDRNKALGNSFQVDTVAYHLSVLKPIFPRGINVLSLFTGIGGGEVALHRLQIPMKVVVSVEISEVNRNVLRSFWEQTNQRGVLREFADVEELDNRTIEHLMDQYGGFDLVIGGSPCNNLSGGNRVSRTGLEGDKSSLFYDYCRILDTVQRKTAAMGN